MRDKKRYSWFSSTINNFLVTCCSLFALYLMHTGWWCVLKEEKPSFTAGRYYIVYSTTYIGKPLNYSKREAMRRGGKRAGNRTRDAVQEMMQRTSYWLLDFFLVTSSCMHDFLRSPLYTSATVLYFYLIACIYIALLFSFRSHPIPSILRDLLGQIFA